MELSPSEVIGSLIQAIRETLYAIDELRREIADYALSDECDPINLQSMALQLSVHDMNYQIACVRLEQWGVSAN